MGVDEEEIFWVMTYLLENVFPKDYFTNMIPLLSDIKLIKYFLKELNPKMLEFLQKRMIDLNMILLPWFLLAFV